MVVGCVDLASSELRARHLGGSRGGGREKQRRLAKHPCHGRGRIRG
jgi:hypothetical protein